MTESISTKKVMQNHRPFVIILLVGAFLAVLNQTLLITATPHIMEEFHISENLGQWVTTIFMLVNGIMIPITAFLMETYSSRRLFIGSMMIFILGTLISAISLNFAMLMVGRIVQAVGAGIIMPLMMTIFMIIYPEDRRGYAMGMAGLVISFAPAIAPTFSGWFVEYLPWRLLFYTIIPLAIIDVVLAYYYMRDIIPRTFPKVDVLSIILSTFGFGGLLYGFSVVGDYGWRHPSVSLSLIIGALCLTLFIRRQFKLKEPILNFRVFSSRIYSLTIIISMVAFMVLIAAETILPIYMQLMAGFSAFESGFMILPGSILMGILSPVIGKIFDAVGVRWLLIIGLSITTVTTLFFTNLTPETSFIYITIVFAIRMVGIVMIMMPSTTAGLNALPERLIAHGTAMSNTMRQVAASIGTALLITVMTVAAKDPSEAGMQGLVDGVNIAFYVATAITLFALILSFFVKDQKKLEIET